MWDSIIILKKLYRASNTYQISEFLEGNPVNLQAELAPDERLSPNIFNRSLLANTNSTCYQYGAIWLIYRLLDFLEDKDGDYQTTIGSEKNVLEPLYDQINMFVVDKLYVEYIIRFQKDVVFLLHIHENRPVVNEWAYNEASLSIDDDINHEIVSGELVGIVSSDDDERPSVHVSYSYLGTKYDENISIDIFCKKGFIMDYIQSLFSHLNVNYIESLSAWEIYTRQRKVGETHEKPLNTFLIGSIYSFPYHVVISYIENDNITLVIGDNDQLTCYIIPDSDAKNIDDCVLQYILRNHNKISDDVAIHNLYAHFTRNVTVNDMDES